jgi:hypothetical protein
LIYSAGRQEKKPGHGSSPQVTDRKNRTELFQRKASQHRMRQMAGGLGLSVRYSRTDPRKYSFAMRTVEPWNKVPDSVKEAPSGKEFRSRLKHL